MSADAVIIRPTVLVRAGEDTLGVVTVAEGEHEALVVFRGPDDARGFQRSNGRYSAGAGFSVVGMERDAIAALLEKHAIPLVAMPEAWTGSAGVDTFTAANFLELLDTAERTPATD